MTSLPAAFREARSRAFAKIRGASITSQTARRWLIIGLVPLLALFVAVGFWRTWTTAFLVLIGLMPPAQSGAGPVGVLLSLAGYALVPLVIGTAVAGLFTRAVERAGEKDFNAAVQRQCDELVKSGKYVLVVQDPADGPAGGAVG
jgi:membrane protein implicated in regulation of membrane protease activity